MTDEASVLAAPRRWRPLWAAALACAVALAGAFDRFGEGAASATAGPAGGGVAGWAILALAALASVLALIGGTRASVALALVGLAASTGAVLQAMTWDGAGAWGYWAMFWGPLVASLHAVGRVTMADTRTPGEARVSRALPPSLVPWVLLLLWQGLVIGYGVPKGIFPSVVDVSRSLAASLPVLMEDAYVTFVKEVAFGFALGLAGGFLTGLAIAYSRFLQRGFLPLAAAFGAVPIVGVAPVLGRAFGVDWESKAAVVVIVTFFPVVLNTVQGLVEVDPLQLELLRAYAARPHEVLLKLRLPNALPFLFNALKLAAVISVISVIVAEFLIPGPPQGLGQRISLSARRGAFDLVFAAIVVSSLISIAFYGALSALERLLTGWHASFRDPGA